MPDLQHRSAENPVKVLFVCLGNICRSPVAEGLFRSIVERLGIADSFSIDSAGTGAWHVGEPPDVRMRETARRHNISLDEIRARKLTEEDVRTHDYVFAMDRSNYADIITLDSSGEYRSRIRLFRESDPIPDSPDVPDPYYGGARGFESVFEIVRRTCEAIADDICESHNIELPNAGGRVK